MVICMNETTIIEDIEYEETKKRPYFYFKRIFDFLVSLFALVILSPFFLAIAIVIKIDSKGSVFFKHKRIGKNGKYIYIYKFRTMVENAEELIKKFDKKQMKEFEKNFKLENDPRITRVGKFLRKTSLDELPQLINILKGDMSLVGPRPVVDGEIDKYGFKKNKFLSVTPGLTGYWACNGRSDIDYDKRIEMELYYVDHCSLILDIKIILKTVVAVIKKEGAK